MNHPILTENLRRRIDRPLWQLVFFAMFCFWQMGFIYYFIEPSSAVDGTIPIPIDVDSATLLTAVGYVLSILVMIFLPGTVVRMQRIATGIALLSALGFFLPLPEDALRLIICLQIFSCCFMIGFETFLVVSFFSERSGILYLTAAYSAAVFLIALVRNELFPIPFSVFRFGMTASLVLLFLFFLRMPAGREILPRFVKRSDGITAPGKLFFGTGVLVFVSALMAVSGPAITGRTEHGAAVMYLVDAAAGFALYLLWRKAKIHPFRLIPILVCLGGLGFLLMLAVPFVPFLSYGACGLIGCGMVSCQISPLYGAVLMKSYPSRYISPVIIALALAAALIHSGIAELFLGAPAALNLVYALIMAALVFLYSQLEPFLLFTLRSRTAGDPVPAAEKPAEETSAHRAEDPLRVLTEKEKQVAELICLGYSNRDIAKVLFVTENTAKDHTKSIYRKTGVHSRLELAALVNSYRLADRNRQPL